MREVLKEQWQKLPFLFGQMLPQSCVNFLNLTIQLPAAHDSAQSQSSKERNKVCLQTYPAPKVRTLAMFKKRHCMQLPCQQICNAWPQALPSCAQFHTNKHAGSRRCVQNLKKQDAASFQHIFKQCPCASQSKCGSGMEADCLRKGIEAVYLMVAARCLPSCSSASARSCVSCSNKPPCSQMTSPS